ncbi:hypothetical protein LSUE1_G006315 [Lachnellula suecica]|uniref:Eisosome protein 1 n=1 Tax=Lachnellula suecica TaxID=602035 RepID=A0A8T9BWH8_9HELO|nr:hypothetical protein LSUE1_G006315 [Lachnellula suecica]
MAQTTAVVPTGPIQDASAPKPHSSAKLEDQAALAALYVTKYDSTGKESSVDGYKFLDKDHKLSSAGAAASLKYAQPQDLPSYPSYGLKKDNSAAGAAASLGWANQKPFEHWKPDPSASASTAAMKAKDYKMAPLWQPESSSHGAKAALLAHKDGGKVEIWKPEPNTWGNSAAAQAFKKFGAGNLSPQVDYGYTDLGRKGSMMAATGAMSSGRKRAESNPTPVAQPETYPDEANAASNALNAATSSMRKKKSPDTAGKAGAVPWTTMPREMYTSNPPVATEVEEKNRADVLHASAVAMAQGMYKRQQAQIEAASEAHHAATAAHGRNDSVTTLGDEQPMTFVNLHEAAQKLAHERLAKLHDEHAKNREYRDYYSGGGESSIQRSSTTSKMSLRGRARRRASSTGTADSDMEQSNKIRAQMSMFSTNLSQVDAKKRQSDREALIAAAQRNVTKSLQGMDQKVFAETGKIGPSLLSEWEVKAHAAAQAKSNNRMENYGKVNIGGGKFINQSAIDLIAQKNVQPVLDEINEKTEQKRVREAELKLEQDKAKQKEADRKSREKEGKEINKKLKQQDKDERKAKEAEEKAAQKEKRKSQKEEMTPATAATATKETPASSMEETPTSPEPIAVIAPAPIRTSMEDQVSMRLQETAAAANKDATPLNPSPTSPKDESKVKNWLKNRFSRRSSRAQKPSSDEKDTSSFVGGAALTGASANNSTASLAQRSTIASPEPVASPVEQEEEEERVGRAARRRDSDVSAASENGEEFQEARDEFDEDLAPPPTFVAGKSSSPARETKFTEEI